MRVEIIDGADRLIGLSRDIEAQAPNAPRTVSVECSRVAHVMTLLSRYSYPFGPDTKPPNIRGMRHAARLTMKSCRSRPFSLCRFLIVIQLSISDEIFKSSDPPSLDAEIKSGGADGFQIIDQPQHHDAGLTQAAAAFERRQRVDDHHVRLSLLYQMHHAREMHFEALRVGRTASIARWPLVDAVLQVEADASACCAQTAARIPRTRSKGNARRACGGGREMGADAGLARAGAAADRMLLPL